MYKKRIALLLAVFTLCSTTGCQQKLFQSVTSADDKNSGNKLSQVVETLPVSETSDVVYTDSYAADTLFGTEYGYGYGEFFQFGNLFALTNNYFGCDSQSVMLTVFTIDQPENRFTISYDTGEHLVSVFMDGNRYCVLTYYYVEPTDEDDYDDQLPVYTVWKYDMDWNEIEKTDVTDKIMGIDLWFASARQRSDGKLVAAAGGNLYLLDTDFQVLEKVEQGTIDHFVLDSNGVPYVMPYSETGIEGLYSCDFEQHTLNPVTVTKTPFLIGSIYEGNEEYLFFYTENGMVYGVSAETEEPMPLMNLAASGFEYAPFSMVHLEDGRFLAISPGIDSIEANIILLRPRTQEEVDSMNLITMAVPNLYSGMNDLVRSYNQKYSDRMIVVKEYGEDSEVYKAELLSGEVPDIICTTILPFQTLANKGIFADLTPYLESMSDFNDDTYFMNFFDALKYEGKYYQIADSFAVLTAVGRTSDVGDRCGMTPSEYLEFAESLPEDRKLLRGYKYEGLQTLVLNCVQNYMDTETKQCHFDSPEFIDCLKLCNSLPSKEEYTQDDNAVLTDLVYSSLSDSLQDTEDYFFNGDAVTLVGLPTSDGGNGGVFVKYLPYAMSSQTKHPDIVWSFFEYMLSEEAQAICYQTPVLRSAARQQMKQGDISPDKAEALYDYFGNVTTAIDSNYSIESIISEEADRYFFGDQSAEDVANTIQSRVSIYISEQY